MRETWNSIEVTKKKVHEFGTVIFIVVGLLIPIIGYFVNDYTLGPYAKPLFYSTLIFMMACVFAVQIMTPVYKSWMLLALIMGFIMTRVIITIVYFSLITPIGIIRRLSGSETPKMIRASKDELKKRSSYWIQRETPYDKESTERQF
jgi:hypothetical protein